MAHLCQFGVKRAQQDSPPDTIRYVARPILISGFVVLGNADHLPSETSSDGKGQKRSFQDSVEAPSIGHDDEEPEDGLKVWGYMPGHVHYKVGAVEDVGGSSRIGRVVLTNGQKISPRKDSPAESTASNAVDKILHAIPPRSITGTLQPALATRNG